MPIPPDKPRQKTLILDLNGVLCKIERSAIALRQAKDLGWPVLGSRTTWVVPRSGLREFLEQVLELFYVIIWTSRTERNTELVLEALEFVGCLPPGVKSGQDMESKSLRQSGRCFQRRYSNFMTDFATLEFWKISTQDVLMIDDSPEKGMTNFPYSALYPPTFTPLVTSPDDDTYLNSKLLPWLKGWGKSVKVTQDYVQEWERKLLLNENCNKEPASPPTAHPPGPCTKSKNPPKHKQPRVARDDVF
ncbi:hypothetical protein R1flu_016229 [Riccia fluitans]|uniref:Mitochondrial import inner membrane translocase subunit TIM50 n=1 Tax=Riccia fluitans TaxID=41844 RepID=A0ABD1YLE9_9MARC